MVWKGGGWGVTGQQIKVGGHMSTVHGPQGFMRHTDHGPCPYDHSRLALAGGTGQQSGGGYGSTVHGLQVQVISSWSGGTGQQLLVRASSQ